MNLTERHKTALNLLLEGNLNKSEIAKCVEVSRTTLYNWIEDADFRAAYDEAAEETDRQIKRRIVNLANRALDRQERILTDSKNDNAAAMVAKDVLDRAGYTAENRLQVEHSEAVVIINDIPRGGDV